MLAFLAPLAIDDFRTRDVPLPVLLAFLASGVVHLIVELPSLPAPLAVLTLALTVIYAAPSLMGVAGVGDALAVAAVAAWSPRRAPVFYLALAAMHAAVFAAILARNLLDPRARRLLSRMPLRERIALAFTARPFKACEVRGWWIPRIPGWKKLNNTPGLTPSDLIAVHILAGRLKCSDVVWASYGVPLISLMLPAYILAVVVNWP